jgi:hypothetical protein
MWRRDRSPDLVLRDRFLTEVTEVKVRMVNVAVGSWAATTVKVVTGGEGGGPMTLTLDQTTVKAGETIFASRRAPSALGERQDLMPVGEIDHFDRDNLSFLILDRDFPRPFDHMRHALDQ